jgi:hypothetical protein
LPAADRIIDNWMILSDNALFHTPPLAQIVAEYEINAKNNFLSRPELITSL